MSSSYNVPRISQFVMYVSLITSNILVQAFINNILIAIGRYFRGQCYPFKNFILMTVLFYVTFIGILIDVFIWTIAVYFLRLYDTWAECFAFSMDAFVTLGGRDKPLEFPWESLAPFIGFTGIVVIAFAGSTLFSVMYPDVSDLLNNY